MKTQRFFGTSAREALARVKASLGEDAIILRNRKTAGGVEILAAADTDWTEPEPAAQDREPGSGATGAQPRDVPVQADGSVHIAAAAAAAPPAMSTIEFQRFAAERQAQLAAGRAGAAPAAAQVASTLPVATEPRPCASVGSSVGVSNQQPASARLAIDNHAVRDELRRMRSFISQQFSALSWVDGVRRSPVQAQLLRRLITAGFSARLSRLLVTRVPADYDDDEALVWLHAALARNVRCANWIGGPFAAGGVYALVGPTGVGKTTTAAKIAAHFALRHGAEAVGLVTMDTYRVAAQHQLETFGGLIGVPVLSARDSDELARHLEALADRRLVLVDTAGISQRDDRVASALDVLAIRGVQSLLVLAASAQDSAIEEIIDAYRGREAAGVVLSKVDEAPRLGGVIDAVVRHRLQISGVADGQRVPEDWHEGDAASLVASALEPRVTDDFLLDDTELTMLMQRIDSVVLDRPSRQALHA